MVSGTFLSSGSCITGANNIYDAYLKAYAIAYTGALGQCSGSFVVTIGSDTYTGIYTGADNTENNAFYTAMVLAIGASKNKYFNISGRCCG